MANFMRKVRKNKAKQQKKTKNYSNLQDLVGMLQQNLITENEFNKILVEDHAIYNEYCEFMENKHKIYRKEVLTEIQEPEEFKNAELSKKCREELLFQIQELRNSLDRVPDGAAHDLPNFCVHSDFDWSRDTIEELFTQMISCEECRDDIFNKELENFFYQEKHNLLKRVDEIESEVIANRLNRISDYVKKENRPGYKGVKALKRLEGYFIEKKVVPSLKKLRELDSYKEAVSYLKSTKQL